MDVASRLSSVTGASYSRLEAIIVLTQAAGYGKKAVAEPLVVMDRVADTGANELRHGIAPDGEGFRRADQVTLVPEFGLDRRGAPGFMIITGQGLHVDRAELFGVLAILAAALMHALCYVVTKQKGAAIRVIIYNTLPIGCAGLMLLLAGLWLEQPDFGAITPRSWAALSYLGLVASVGGFIVYFFLLKRLSPIILSFVFIIFPVFAVVIGAWYEGASLSPDLLVYSAVLLAGFAITKLPIEKL